VAGSTVGIFGTGVMAGGIAALCLDHGLDLVLLSNSPDRADRLRAELLESGAGGRVSTDRVDLHECSLLVEATVEDLSLKQAVLSEVEGIVRPDAVLATTTSSLSVTELGAALLRPERLVGLHFFNPVAKMKLVEVVGGVRSSDGALERAKEIAGALGKHPLVVPDAAGFLVNRLLIPYLNQAALLVERNVATAEDIDTAMKLGARHPMGPLALIDLIGADVCAAIGRSLERDFHRTSDSPPPELRRRVALGWLGRKTGRGYYRYGPGGRRRRRT
jgi:3-hydroxybutyryl-CoA dehydrogenase